MTIIINLIDSDGESQEITLDEHTELSVRAFAAATGMSIQAILDRAMREELPKVLAEAKKRG